MTIFYWLSPLFFASTSKLYLTSLNANNSFLSDPPLKEVMKAKHCSAEALYPQLIARQPLFCKPTFFVPTKIEP